MIKLYLLFHGNSNKLNFSKGEALTDTVIYGAIKEDWERGNITPIEIDALPF